MEHGISLYKINELSKVTPLMNIESIKIEFIEKAKILLEHDPFISINDLLAEYKVIPYIRQPRPPLDFIEASGYRHDGMGNLIGKAGRILRGSRDGSIKRKKNGARSYKDYQLYNLRIKGYGSNGLWSCQGHTLIFALVHRRWPRDGYVLDHIDNDTFNNHPDNLREITNRENHPSIKNKEQRKRLEKMRETS